MGQRLATWAHGSLQTFKSRASLAARAVKGHWMLQAWPEFWDGEAFIEGDEVRDTAHTPCDPYI
jgi:hypothetical protein